MNESAVTAAVIIGLLALGIGLYVLQRAWRRRAVRRWAADHAYTLLACDQPILREATPFPFTVSKAQQVFHVSVLEKNGRRRSGWLLLGSGLLGLASDQAVIKWDDAT